MSSVTCETKTLEMAVKDSLDAWQNDLKYLVEHAKDRFPDVIWKNDGTTEGSDLELVKRSIWGHKAIIYARTSPNLHASHLCADDNISYTPLPYASLSSKNDLKDGNKPFLSLQPSVFLAPPGTMVHLKAPPNPQPLIQNLRRIYYALECDSQVVAESDEHYLISALDALRQDLRFAWGARLSSDIQLQVALAGNKAIERSDTQNGMQIFWTHRFILVSRSPYFLNELERVAKVEKDGRISDDLQVLTLPSPLFTPRSLFVILDFIYTGTLVYYHRSYGLGNAFAIYRGAKYLMIDSLVNEVRMRIVEEFLHGLFSAALPREEYALLVECQWHRMAELGGCICEECVGRLAQVLEFSLSGDINDEILGRGARRAAVGMFGVGWCSPGFSQLPRHIWEIILNDLIEFINPDNFFRLLFASEKALHRLNNQNEGWTDTVKTLVTTVRDMLDGVLVAQPEFCLECAEWMDIMHQDRIGELEVLHIQGDETRWMFDAISRASPKDEALKLYKTLISSVLLRRHPTDNTTLFLPRSSYIRSQVNDLLKQFPPLTIDLPRFSNSFDDPSVSYDHHDSDPLIATENQNDIRLSVPESIETYIYSFASSRTVSTDYGYYYTRRALSMEMESIESEDLRLRILAIWSALISSVDRYSNYGIGR